MAHRILIVDGDRKHADTLETYLGRGLGYEVDCVPDGESALDQALHQTYDIALVDAQPPDMPGAEAYQRLHSLQPEMEVIFMAAAGQMEQALDYLRFTLPAERILAKPLTDMSILTRLIVGILGPPVA